MSIFIIPDIHEDLEWVNAILGRMSKGDTAVCLGDYCDNYDSNRMAEVCGWLKSMLDRPDVSLLIGNHDQAYIGMALGIRAYLCSGWTPQKQKVFDAAFKDPKELLQRLHLYDEVGQLDETFILTHAGLSLPFVEEYIPEGEHPLSFLDKAKAEFLEGRAHPALMAGADRGGYQAFGGVTWGDWREFEPIDGLKQIVGHTKSNKVREKAGNFCLDTNQNHYTVIDDEGVLTVFTGLGVKSQFNEKAA